MNVLIVLAHPEPKSFNAALANAAYETLSRLGHRVAMSDLNAMKFSPISDRSNFVSAKDPAYLRLQIEEAHASEVGRFAADLEVEMRKLEACDLMIWQFPLWWFGLPAILKGWVDRVFALGRFYGGGRMYETGTQRGKRALLSLTTGGPSPAYRPDGAQGDLGAILKPIHRGMLQFIGFDVLAPNVVFAPVRLAAEERAAALTAWRDRLARIESELPIEIGGY